jgi:hypothetical protein
MLTNDTIEQPVPIGNLIDISGLTQDEIKALEEYRQSVALLAKGGLNLEFNNKDERHAVFVMTELFKNAQQSIKIFTGSFSGEISNQPGYWNELKNGILNSDKKVEVIFENEPNSKSICLEGLKKLKAQGRDVSLCVLTEDYRKLVQENNIGHFTIGDDTMFRYETDKIKFTAFCNFDDKDVVKVLNRNFAAFRVNASVLN